MFLHLFLAATALVQDTPTERLAAHDVIRKMGDLEKSLDVPSLVTKLLRAMFCALKGATLKPRRAYQRARAVTRKLFPAPLVVPQTMTARAEPLDSMKVLMSVLIASTRWRWVSSPRVLGPCTWVT